MTLLEQLVVRLKGRGVDVTPEQAEAMAIRISGSVAAHMATMDATDRHSADYRPLDIPEADVSDKFKEPLAVVVKPAKG